MIYFIHSSQQKGGFTKLKNNHIRDILISRTHQWTVALSQ